MNSTSPRALNVLTIEEATTPQSMQDAAGLLTGCAGLPGAYAPPHGALLLARIDGTAVGCIAARPSEPGVCDMQHLFVLPEQRGRKIGRRLCHALLRQAHRSGYTHMRVASGPGMTAARHLFHRMPFPETTPYGNNPNPDTRYYEINLTKWCTHSAHLDRYLSLVHSALGICETDLARQALPRVTECCHLADVGPDMFGRAQRLSVQAALQWQALYEAGQQDGITLQLVSAFRSIEYQAALIAEKLSSGRGLDDILSVNAAPGFSEHHSGDALDISTPGTEPLTEAFETTPAFDWLSARAAEFGFSLSYGRDNPHALVYEPWHWRWKAPAEGGR